MLKLSRLIGCGSMVVMLAVFTSGDASGQKKDKKDKTDPGYPATDADYAQIKNNKNLTGKMLVLDSATNTVTIRVETTHMEPNPNYKPPAAAKGSAVSSVVNLEMQIARTTQELQNKQQQALNARTPQERQKALNAIQSATLKLQQEQAQLMIRTNGKGVNTDPNNQPLKSVSTFKDYTFDVQDEIPVRKLYLGTEYDDTGNLKKYTDKEKEELRGTDKSKPGYKAGLEDLQTNQEIKLYLTAPKKKDTKAEDDADKDSKPRPTVNMIVMTKEMAPAAATPAPAKGKK